MNDGILLKTCENRDNFFLIKKHINKEIVGKQTCKLLDAWGDFYLKFADIKQIPFNDFFTWFISVHTPDIKSRELELYKILGAKVGESNSVIARDLVEAYKKKDILSQLQDAILRNKPLSEIQTIVNSNVSVEKDNHEFSMDILDDIEFTDRSRGLTWRLDKMNHDAGAIIAGDFVVIAGRFDSGKSSWIISECTYMAEQIQDDKNVLLLVNERPPIEYKERIYQSAFGISIEELKSNRAKYKDLYIQKMKRLDKIKLFNISRMHFGEIENIIKKNNPGLICIDMIDHIGGFISKGNEASDQKIRSLYRWIGDIPLHYNIPVIGTTQVSDESKEKNFDSRWPSREALTGSRTAKQEAPNLIITIGQENDLNSTTRYIGATKNKFKAENNYFKFSCKFDKINVRFI